MRKLAFLVCPLLLAGTPAIAASAAGHSGLALAALVAAPSPLLSPSRKHVMALMLNGSTSFSFPANQTIAINADAVTCRASNVAIQRHSCQLTYGGIIRNLAGRAAHELYATIAEVGVGPDGAAGSEFESVSHLACTIDPNAVKEQAGGGANCTFTPGP